MLNPKDVAVGNKRSLNDIEDNLTDAPLTLSEVDGRESTSVAAVNEIYLRAKSNMPSSASSSREARDFQVCDKV